MDPFTQRMLERARARREKIDSKLAGSGQEVTPRKPLAENKMAAVVVPAANTARVKSPESKSTLSAARRPSKDCDSTAARPPQRRPSGEASSELTVRSPARRRSRDARSRDVCTVGEQGGNDLREVCVTTTEYIGGTEERNSDVSVEINIVHRDDVQIHVQVEEGDARLALYPAPSRHVAEGNASNSSDKENSTTTRSGLRQNAKSRLDRLGILYSDKPELSSPIHRTEGEFTSATPPQATRSGSPRRAAPEGGDGPGGRRKLARLAALADTISGWEDDTARHHPPRSEAPQRSAAGRPAAEARCERRDARLDESTLDVSIHSLRDINRVVDASKSAPSKSPVKSHAREQPTPSSPHRLNKSTVAALEAVGYRREAAGQSRLVYDFSTSAPHRHRQEASATPSAAGKMAAAVATHSASVVKKPSIKKYKAPTPPGRLETNIDDDAAEPTKDSQNNVLDKEENANDVSSDCIQTNEEQPIKADEPSTPPTTSNKSSPMTKRAAMAPKLNGHDGELGSVMSKAALFENGSPFQRDPTTMSIRERKALFEKNKGAAIVPKAPFGQAPSAKMLQGASKAVASPPAKTPASAKPVVVSAATKSPASTKSNASAKSTTSISTKSTSSQGSSREELPRAEAGAAGSGGGGIRGKLAALFNKEQTISEASIGEKCRRERQQELEMLQNRFHFKPKTLRAADSDTESEPDPSERAPLMSSSLSLNPTGRKPEIASAAAAPPPPHASLHSKCKSETALHGRDEPDVVGAQPAKRRSSQDSPVVLSVLEDVKRIKMQKKEPNGLAVEPVGLYPHLSDIETATSSAPDDESDCGGSRCGHYALDTEDIVQERHKIRLNSSDNWAETSFGRDIMQSIKKKTHARTVSFELDASAASGSSGAGASLDSDMDELLEEALDQVSEHDSHRDDGPTPPKLNKSCNSLSSKSFTYREGSPLKHKSDFKSPHKSDFKSPLKSEFKSPLKTAVTPARSEPRRDDLVHSVSFYRRMQNAQSSQQWTPVRRAAAAAAASGGGTEGGGAGAGEEQERERQRVSTVRQRIAELQAEIAKQHTVISQASQALNLCAATVEFSGSTEQAEAERLLLLATHRRQACLHEVQRLQVEGAGPAAERGAVSLTLARVTVPLRRDYIRQLNADGALGHYCVCLLKCRDRVIATSMQLTQPSSTTLTFPDQVHMDGLAGDFKVTVEVYLLQASKEQLPHDLKYHITSKKPSSKLLTPRSKVSELKAPRVQSPGGPASVRSPQLQPHGYCIFSLQQAERTAFTLNKVPHGSPLEGSVGVQISAVLSLPPPAPHAAFLTAFDDVSGLGAWHRRWCVLQPPRLSWWKYPDDVRKKLPMGDLDLATVVSERVTRAPRDLCARPHTLLVEASAPHGELAPDAGSLVYRTRDDGTVVRRHLLAADTQEDRDAWLAALNRALEYVRCNPQSD